jgi:DNA-binding transcriptional LysR family regulator
MGAMKLEEIDLNLLVVFKHLLAERSVSRVADALGLTQPAVSNALARLRKLLGDDLFLRTPAGMVPTPFAEQLAESVTYALGMIHAALNQRATFEPRESERSFVVGMTDIGEIYFLPLLMDLLRRQAPGIRLSTCRNTAGNLRDDMEAGKVDLAIGLLPTLKGGFFQRRLFTQSYVCMLRQGHRPPGGRLGGNRPWARGRHPQAPGGGAAHCPDGAAFRGGGPHPADDGPGGDGARTLRRAHVQALRPGGSEASGRPA